MAEKSAKLQVKSVAADEENTLAIQSHQKYQNK